MRDALEIARDLLNITGDRPLTADEKATLTEAFVMLQRLHNCVVDIVRITKEERARMVAQMKRQDYPPSHFPALDAVELLGKHLSTSSPSGEVTLERKERTQ